MLEGVPLDESTPGTTVAPTTTVAGATTTVAGAATTVAGRDDGAPRATTVPTATHDARHGHDGARRHHDGAGSSGIPTTPAPEDDATKEVVLPEVKDKNGNVTARYLLGPAFLTGSAVETAARQFDQNGNEYVVSLTLKGGDNGIDTWNKVAQQCFNGEATCPAGARPDAARSPSPSTAT